MKIKRALVSVSDKAGLEEFVKGLDRLGVEIISTGGTAKAISSMGISVVETSSYTGYPEMLDGRVKTLHPMIHAGLLAVRGNEEHERQMKKEGIPYIDMVVVNLYPFEETIAREGVTIDEATENIDIGGPSMIRSAAKNFNSVAVVSSPCQYERVLVELGENGGEISGGTLRGLAIEAFKKTSGYDNAIYGYLSEPSPSGEPEALPRGLNIKLEKVRELRYGENPHQKAVLYKDTSSKNTGIAAAGRLQGRQLSFNNIMDLSAAVDMVKCFSGPAAVVVKHNNPCGAASADTLEQAYIDALDCDRMSAFGGIMSFNRPIEKKMAELILKEAGFMECIVAPGYDDGALEVFKGRKNLRVVKMDFTEKVSPADKDIKKVMGGILVQDIDSREVSRQDLEIVTRKSPPEDIIDALIFADKIAKRVKSNAIVLCRGTRTVGIGAGQMSRVDSVIIAIRKAGGRAKGAVLASDAFFPMPDSIEEAHKAGIIAIIQPGGSIRDNEVIAACDKFGISMVFTGTRHFRH